MTYLVELWYHDGHYVEYGHAEEKTPELLDWRRRLRWAHRDVRAGRANASIRKAGAS